MGPKQKRSIRQGRPFLVFYMRLETDGTTVTTGTTSTTVTTVTNRHESEHNLAINGEVLAGVRDAALCIIVAHPVSVVREIRIALFR